MRAGENDPLWSYLQMPQGSLWFAADFYLSIITLHTPTVSVEQSSKFSITHIPHLTSIYYCLLISRLCVSYSATYVRHSIIHTVQSSNPQLSSKLLNTTSDETSSRPLSD